MDYVLQVFGNIPLSTVIVLIAAIAFLFAAWKKFYKALMEQHDNNQEKEAKLNKIISDLEVITAEQKDMKISIENLTQHQRELGQRMDQNEQEKKVRDRNKLRDKLLDKYRFYTNPVSNPTLSWSELEKETFDNLYKDYEEMGGNSFMHTEVRPAMEKLMVVSSEDQNAISELMLSRLQG